MKALSLIRLSLLAVLALSAPISQASVQLVGTRLVFPAADKEASILAVNKDGADVMIQSWIEPYSADVSQDVPFVLTPPLSRLNSGKQQNLRVLYQGQGLPTDRESVFWLVVQEIPQEPKTKNTLQIAVRQRIKLFYRPTGLPGKSEEVPAKLRWRVVQREGKPALEVSNPTAFHVSFSEVALRSGGQLHAVPMEMLMPGATQTVEVKDASAAELSGARVEFSVLNDFGSNVGTVSELVP